MLTKSQRQHRQRLIDALRSGQYQQGHGRLRTRDNRFCCQGVACDLYDPTGWRPSLGMEYWWRDDYRVTWSPSVEHALGFDAVTSSALINMNDGWWDDSYTLREECTFEEIADCLELLTLAGL